MIYISRLRLKNFKSFKAVNIDMPQSFLCLAGPNGSGKSNLTDSVRFVLGEIALKSLRAKKVKDLIHTNAKAAEVIMEFDGDEKIELRRAIREDGKIMYRLNGKKTTRSMILDFMKKFNLDDSGRNIIAQGEVARIINMGGKERRQIIDSVAGISDFEQKKKESMRELDTVDTRIKDANLVLGERQAFLAELEREKEDAIKFRQARSNLQNAKGTLLKSESERLSKEFEKIGAHEQKIRSQINEKEKEHAQMESQIADKEMQRHQTSRTLQEKQQTSSLVRKIEELKASVSSKSQMITDKEEMLTKGESELVELSKDVKDEEAKLAALEKSIKELREQLTKLEPLAGDESTVESTEIQTLRNSFNNASEELSKAREQSIALKSDIESKREIISIKQAELERLDIGDEEEKDFEADIEKLRSEAKALANDIDNSFSRTKEINAEIGELDKRLLELKETASIYKVRASPHLANPALQLVSTMKEKDPTIHGTVADLLRCDSQYTHAVEAAAGSRLLYVVVDDLNSATAVIDKLKKAKAGRSTFIPMNEVRVERPVEHNGFSSILDVIKCPSSVRRAMEYVFANTLLVDTVADAKRIGVGKFRIVTMDGEIFERSGIVSGGRAQSSILSGNQLRKIEDEISQVKSSKDSLISELYSLREEESGLRAKKSEIEIKIKTIEMEANAQAEDAEERKRLITTKKEIDSSIAQLQNEIEQKTKELEATENQIQSNQAEIEKLKQSLEEATKRYEAQSAESNRKKTQLASKTSELRATVEGKINEQQIRSRELAEKKDQIKEIEVEKKEATEKIGELQAQVKIDSAELTKYEEKISSYSKAIEKLFATIKEFEEELKELGRERGVKRMELDKLNKDFNQLEVKKATVSTRLEDVSAEFSGFSDFEFLDEMNKESLMKMIKESELVISSMPNVNMAAIEMYDKKKSEIEGVEEKITKLEEERKAILEMISEIEQHKKDAYFKTFYEVSENFKKMFGYLNIGEGYLYMDKPNDPFESGLFIKIKRNGADHSIDSLSGGENSLVALMFIFAMQFFKPSPFYILDEVDAALDKENSKNLAKLILGMAEETQFILVSHNDVVMSMAGTVLGVTRVNGVSKLVGVKLEGKAG
jgi:chromosome segregation protein